MIILRPSKECELRRAEYYKKKLKKVEELYKPAMQLQGESHAIVDSMVGELVLSPFLLLFTIWVLKAAKKDGITRLYFLARDGYPAYKLACKLCEKYEIGIECKYLYCSRYSLRVPMYSENIEEMLGYICRSGIDVTIHKVLKRAGLQESEITILKQRELYAMNFEETLSYSQLNELKNVLRANTAFVEMVVTNSRKQWTSLRDYFVQEGLTDDQHIGLVDSGWIGSTQKSICEILRRMGVVAKLDGYYWGLYDIPHDMEAEKYHSFFFDRKHGMRNKIFFSNCLVETVFSNTHGTTISYERKEEKVIPVLQDKFSNAEFIIDFNHLVEQYTDIFLDTCSREAFERFDIKKTVGILSKSLLKFMYNPTIDEADFFGKLRFSDDLLDDNTRELGPVFDVNELRENHFFNRVLNAVGIKNTFVHESAWFGGTVCRSTKNTNWHNYSYSAYRLLSYLKKSL